ncbi:hypothetical protein [Paenibacillus sp. 481]|uniref:hypothetical protein n=1 Tax=Paenibacillus sp. 481 TaxID=2835869 RepID=UPI001E61D981|nr:hypothetical protein [Paenibacillus sp. 481]
MERNDEMGSRDEDEDDEEGQDAGAAKDKAWDEMDWDGKGLLLKNSDRLRYQDSMDRILLDQPEVPECPLCREYMLLAGQETMGDNQFKAHTAEALDKPLLAAPFALDVYVCTSCFQVSKVLAEPHREALMDNVRNSKSE